MAFHSPLFRPYVFPSFGASGIPEIVGASEMSLLQKFLVIISPSRSPNMIFPFSSAMTRS